MPVALDDILAGLSPQRRARIAELAADFEREEAELDAAIETADAAGRFEIYQDERGAFHFRLVAANGGVLVNSEGFASREETTEAIEALRIAAGRADPLVASG